MTIDTLVNLISYLGYHSNNTIRNSNNVVNYCFEDQDRAIHFFSSIDDLIDHLELCDVEVSLRADFDVCKKTFSYTVKLIGE